MFIRTVLGDIAPEELGPCGAHEHVFIGESFPTYRDEEFRLDDVNRIGDELRRFYEAGGRSMVDAMPCDAGRAVLRLAEISRRTGVKIVAPTGLHLAANYPPGHWSERLDAEGIAELFAADIEIGIDELDYGAPVVKRTEHRAGVIKVASGGDRLTELEKKVFHSAVLAARATGAPILTHTEQGTAALEQVELLRSRGADLRHVVVSHTDRLPDEGYHREILSSGVRLEYDSGFRWPADGENHTVRLISRLLPEFPEQIVVGMDAAKRKYWRSYGGKPGLQFLLVELREMLRAAGVSEELLERLLVANPAAAYSFER